MSRLLSLFAFCGAILAILPTASAAEAIDLSPSAAPHGLLQIAIELEVGGDLLVYPAGETTGESTDLPMSVVANLVYIQKELNNALLHNMTSAQNEKDNDPPQETAPAAIRYYEKAEATIKASEGGIAPKLPEKHRLVAVQMLDTRARFASPGGPLQRTELDLIDTIGNPLAFDDLLPADPVHQGDTWKQTAQQMGALLCLDSVDACEVESVLDKLNANYAQVRIAGFVTGVVDGAVTEIEIRGLYMVDRRIRQITRFNIATREKRSIGQATPGLEATAKLRMRLEPVDSSPMLSEAAVAEAAQLIGRDVPPLEYVSQEHAFRLLHDPQWYVIGEDATAVSLRRIDDSGLIANGTVARLPRRSAGRQTTLEDFEKDIRFALGDRFGELVTTQEWTNQHGRRCFGVVVRGEVQELPIQWHYYLVAPVSGHRVTLTFTMQGPMAERLGIADQRLVDSLDLIGETQQAEATAERPDAGSVR